jgi:antitoxin HicB
MLARGAESRAMSATLTYSIVLEPMEEGGFLVHVPALPEVVTGGDTEEEALAMAREAIELVLESRRERGEEIPVDIAKPQVREVTVSIAA